MQIQSDGLVVLHLSIRVTVEEMATWSPRRIYAFFEGLAKARAAIEGPRPQPLLLEYKPSPAWELPPR